MKVNTLRSTILVLLFALLAPSLFSQAADLPNQAREAYRIDSYERAYSILADGLPEASTNTPLKRQAANALADIGEEEYNRKNYKNAYESFRKALKYDPSNTRATQYFLKMRKEMDTAALKNEGAPKTKTTATASAAKEQAEPTSPVEAAPAPVPPPTPAPAAQAAPPAPTAPPPPSVSDVELAELKSALQEAGKRMESMEQSVSGANKENEALKAQAEQQVKLLQAFMETQAKNAEALAKSAEIQAKSVEAQAKNAEAQAKSAEAQAKNAEAQAKTAKAAPAPAAAPQQSAQEKALIAQTMALLAKMSEKESAPPQVVVQTDPELKSLMERLAAQEKAPARTTLDIVILGLLIAIGVAFIAIATFVVVLFLRAKARATHASAAFDGSMATSGPQLGYRGGAGRDTQLLEFISSKQGPEVHSGELEIRRELLKAERLNRMFGELRAGTLGWDTVRDFIGELDIELKSEILAVVEQKLNGGELLTSEAALPVLFPFLTDYDDFIRDKSERLARRALTDARTSGDEETGSASTDPLDLKALMEIPQQLQLLFKKQDPTLITAKLSRGVGSALGLSTEDCNLLYKTALAHDCGYLMLDHDKLQRTIAKSEITEEDFTFIQSHVLVGPSYFGEIELPEQFRDGLLHHHERNDGSGYPNGLRKDEIPLFAKIIGISETLAALVSKRPYREKRDIQHALAIVSDGTRSKFDAPIVEALVKVANSIGRL